MSSEAYRNVAKALLEAQRELDAALIALQELEASAKRAGWIRAEPNTQDEWGPLRKGARS